MNDITKLRFWCHKILPLVYDDSLSYYEVLTKVQKKINELVDSSNEIPEAITAEVTKQLSEGYSNNITEQVQNLIDAICKGIATDEGKATFTATTKKGGELIWLDGILYKVTAVMDAGVNYIIGTNIEPIVIADEINKIKTEYLEAENEHWNTRAERPHTALTYMYWKDNLYQVTKDIAVNDILYDSGDNQNLTSTYFGKEIYNHYIEMHKSDNNLQTQIDGNDGDIEALQNKDIDLQNQITTNNNNTNNRISNIVAQSGNDNTEIVDARKTADKLGGSTSATLGDSIRTQILRAITFSSQLNKGDEDGNFNIDTWTDSNSIRVFNKAFKGKITGLPDGVTLGGSLTFIINIGNYNPLNVIQQIVIPSPDLTNYYYRQYGDKKWRHSYDTFALKSQIGNTISESYIPKQLNPAIPALSEMGINDVAFFAGLSHIFPDQPANYAPSDSAFTMVLTLPMYEPTGRTSRNNGALQILKLISDKSSTFWRTLNPVNNTWSNWHEENPYTVNSHDITIGEGQQYTTLRDGINAAVNASSYGNPFTVHVKPGTYDLIKEFESEINNYATTSAAGIGLGNGIKIIFEAGSYVKAIWTPTDDSAQNSWVATNFQPFYALGSDFELNGLNIECSGTRYCVHDERFASDPTYHHVYKNCVMKMSRPEGHTSDDYYHSCIGGGLGKHGYIDIEGGYYNDTDENNPYPITYHNGNSNECDSKIFCRDVYIEGNGTFRISNYGPSTKITTAYVSGCRLGRDIIHTNETTSSITINTAVVEWNNTYSNSEQ